MKTIGRPRAMTTRDRRRLTIVGLALMALGAVPVAGTSAATTDAAGWWSQASSPLPVNPTAPNVEEGQLHVQGQPSGPTAVAAVRWTLAEGEGSPVLTLKPADGSVVPAEAVIRACPAATPWQEAHGGPWEEAPEADCAIAVDGVVAPDGSAVEFSLTALVKATTLDIVLLPGESADGGGSTFSFTFDRPGPDALATTSSSTSPGGSSTGTGTSSGGFDTSGSGSGADSGAGSGSGSSSGSFSPSGGGSFVAPPSSPSFEAPATGEAASPPAAAVGEETTEVAAGSAVTAGQSSSPGGSSSNRPRNLGILVLLSGVAVVAWAWMASAPTPAAATAAAETAPAGLGRFSRSRSSAPPSLS